MENNNAAEYTVVINGKPQGPFTLRQLAELKIRTGTFIRKPGMDDYKEAHELPELRALLGLKYQQTAPQYFASFDQRLLASVIDYFLLLLLFIFLVLISFLFITEKEARMAAALGSLPFLPVAKFIYGSIAEAMASQGTAGKRLLNIKVTDLMGNRLSLGESFLRNGAKIISVATLFFGYLYCFLNRKQQCLHDVVANTLVIKDRLI